MEIIALIFLTIPVYILLHYAFIYILPSYISIILRNDIELKKKCLSLIKVEGKRTNQQIYKNKYWNKSINRGMLSGAIFLFFSLYFIIFYSPADLSSFELIMITFGLYILIMIPINLHKTAKEIIEDCKTEKILFK